MDRSVVLRPERKVIVMTTLVDVEKSEREALLGFLDAQRGGLRRAAYGLTDEQAAARSTASALSLGGLIKHAGLCERGWIAMMLGVELDQRDWEVEFTMQEGETLDGLLTMYEEVAGETERAVRGLPDLEVRTALPEAPWFPPGATRSARWILLHLIEEAARHAGHADILREQIDGSTGR
jgi:uncharacterized damage-inducible protein DinB